MSRKTYSALERNAETVGAARLLKLLGVLGVELMPSKPELEAVKVVVAARVWIPRAVQLARTLLCRLRQQRRNAAGIVRNPAIF